MFALQNAPVGEVRLGEVAVRPLGQETATREVRPVADLSEQAGGWSAVWEYSTDLFDGGDD